MTPDQPDGEERTAEVEADFFGVGILEEVPTDADGRDIIELEHDQAMSVVVPASRRGDLTVQFGCDRGPGILWGRNTERSGAIPVAELRADGVLIRTKLTKGALLVDADKPMQVTLELRDGNQKQSITVTGHLSANPAGEVRGQQGKTQEESILELQISFHDLTGDQTAAILAYIANLQRSAAEEPIAVPEPPPAEVQAAEVPTDTLRIVDRESDLNEVSDVLATISVGQLKLNLPVPILGPNQCVVQILDRGPGMSSSEIFDGFLDKAIGECTISFKIAGQRLRLKGKANPASSDKARMRVTFDFIDIPEEDRAYIGALVRGEQPTQIQRGTRLRMGTALAGALSIIVAAYAVSGRGRDNTLPTMPPPRATAPKALAPASPVPAPTLPPHSEAPVAPPREFITTDCTVAYNPATEGYRGKCNAFLPNVKLIINPDGDLLSVEMTEGETLTGERCRGETPQLIPPKQPVAVLQDVPFTCVESRPR